MLVGIYAWLSGIAASIFSTFGSFEETAIGRFWDVLKSLVSVLIDTFAILSIIPPVYLLLILFGLVVVVVLRIVGR